MYKTDVKILIFLVEVINTTTIDLFTDTAAILN